MNQLFGTIIEVVVGLVKGAFVSKVPDKQIPTPPGFKKPSLQFDFDTSRAWHGLVIHHSVSPDGVMRDTDAIRHYHMSYRIDGTIVDEAEFRARKATWEKGNFEEPFKNIAYHWTIEHINGVIQLINGRPANEAGAHCNIRGVPRSFNKEYLGLCVIGNFGTGETPEKGVPPSQEIIDFTLLAVRAIMRAYRISAENVLGHREIYDLAGVPRQKQCPGIFWDLNILRGDL